MAPSLDCGASLFCSEFSDGWDDEIGSFCEDVLDNTRLAMRSVEQAELDWVIATLVESESDYMPQVDYFQRFQDRTLDARARQNAVSWLLKVQRHYKFGPLTAALSVNYLDRYLSHHQLQKGKGWMLQLASVACLSLAAKMEEIEVPLLLDLQVEGAEPIFEPRTIQRMELLVLNTLDWRLSSVTPFSYIDHFIEKLATREQFRRPLLSRIDDLLLNTLRDTNFLHYRPSCIAFAAALCASEDILPIKLTECKEILLPFASLQASSESCFQLMQESLIVPFRFHFIAKPLRFAPISSPTRVFDASFSCDTYDNTTTTSSPDCSGSVACLPTKKRRIEGSIRAHESATEPS